MNDKQMLRARMRAMRQNLSAGEQALASQAVCRRVMALSAYRGAKTVMAYMAARGEISLAGVVEDVLASGRALLLPRCEAPGVITARRITDASQLVRGAYGLMEPDAACEIAAQQEIELILVPGTAFDRAGLRLGQGGGYYDRFLENTDALRVGVCHEGALLARVPADAHDAQMHAVITPGETIWLDEYRRNGHG